MLIKNLPKCMSLNKYRNANYHVINNEKIEYERIVRCAIQESGENVRPLKTPIKTIFTFYEWRGRDSDGEAIGIKNFHDALTDLGMIPDDKRKFLRAFEVKAPEIKGNYFDVEIIEDYMIDSSYPT